MSSTQWCSAVSNAQHQPQRPHQPSLLQKCSLACRLPHPLLSQPSTHVFHHGVALLPPAMAQPRTRASNLNISAGLKAPGEVLIILSASIPPAGCTSAHCSMETRIRSTLLSLLEDNRSLKLSMTPIFAEEPRLNLSLVREFSISSTLMLGRAPRIASHSPGIRCLDRDLVLREDPPIR